MILLAVTVVADVAGVVLLGKAQGGVSHETLRKIETGRVPTPAFFTVAALAGALDVPLDRLLADLAPTADDTPLTA